MRLKFTVWQPIFKLANRKLLLPLLFLFCCFQSFAKEPSQASEKAKYKINLERVSLVQFVKFVGKVGEVNFLFNEDDLQFPITIISEEGMDQESLMSSLIQILRSHGLQITEQENNLLIHTSEDVKQMAPLASLDAQDPIVTRVFHLNNAKVESLFPLIQSMISTQAILQAVPETRLLVVTDLSSNLKNISELIELIDLSSSPIQFAVYDVKLSQPTELIALTQKIMDPMLESNPFQLIAQEHSGKIYIVSTPALIDKATAVLTSLDTGRRKGIHLLEQKQEIFIYKPIAKSAQDILDTLKNIATNMEQTQDMASNLTEMIDSAQVMKEPSSILFMGDDASLSKLKELLTFVDQTAGKSSFYIYKIKNVQEDQIQKALKIFAENLQRSKMPNEGLIETIEQAKYIPETHSLVFTGSEGTLAALKEVLPLFDEDLATLPISSAIRPTNTQFFIYHPVNADGKELESSLRDIMQNLKSANLADPSFLYTISSMKWLPTTRSLLFTGDKTSLTRIENILKSLDTKQAVEARGKSYYFLYALQNTPGNVIEDDLDQFADQLKSEKIPNNALIEVLQNAKWVKETNSILLTGDPNAIEAAKGLIAKYDVIRKDIEEKQHFLLYKPKYISPDSIEQAVHETATNLEKANLSDPHFLSTLSSMKYIPATRSFAFTGDQESLNKVQALLTSIDGRTEQISTDKAPSNFFLYRPKNISAKKIESALNEIASNLEKTKLADPNFLTAVSSMKNNETTNTLSFTGTEAALEKIGNTIKTIDVKADQVTKELPQHFFIYKPKYLPAETIQSSLQDTAANLAKANLANPDFLQAIRSMKYVSSTNSLAFTGDEASLKRIEDLIETIDIPGDIVKKEPGKITYLIYPLQSANAQAVINAMRSITEDLSKSGAADPSFLAALKSMKYKKENHSLMFTGTPDALDHVKKLVVKFDLEREAVATAEMPSAFLVYKPKYLSGPSIESILHDFADHLQLSGMSNPNLFQSIMSMKWDDKTKSLYFTGSEKVLDEVKSLLDVFDIPDQRELGAVSPDNLPTVDNTAFLVYKLQYHKGNEIQTALKQIAEDLSKSKTLSESSLVIAIQSVQWIQVTNTLLCSGKPEAMKKLKELVRSLDIPLKQVFIEMLVLETTLNNNMNFGLDWASKFQYKNQLTGAVSNFQPTQQTITGPTSGFPKSMNKVSSQGVDSSAIQPFSGFDLGIIGDLIRYNGKAFLSLGTLIQALQQDSESTIVTTPKLLTQDGKTSKIFIGRNIPFTGSLTNITGPSSSTTTSLEYRDIGMGVTITPFLGNNDVVSLTIDLENTAALSQVGQASAIQGLPTTKTSMNTTVHIPNKNFLILSGMVNETTTRNRTGIPCLGGIPWIGAAFSQTNNADTRSNIVIFIRPHIINSYKDMVHVTQSQENFFSERSGSQTLENDFNEKMELIKAYDDEE